MAETPTTPEGTTPTPPPPAPEAPEFRYADDDSVPIELRGRTAAEAAEIFTMYTSGAGPVVPPSPPAPTPPPTNGGYASASDLQQLAAQQAAMTFNLARQEHGDAFKRWGPEIAEVLQRIPQPQWTLDAIRSAVELVKGRHVEELVAERVRTATIQSGGGMRSNGMMRSGGNGGPSHAPQTPDNLTERVPEEWLKHAEQAGISDQEVAEFERANDMLPGDFLRQFNGKYITDAVADVNFARRKV